VHRSDVGRCGVTIGPTVALAILGKAKRVIGESYRMVALVRIALRRPYTFVVLALLLLIIGPLAASRTPVDIFPEIRIPIIAAVWPYTGLPPKRWPDASFQATSAP